MHLEWKVQGWLWQDSLVTEQHSCVLASMSQRQRGNPFSVPLLTNHTEPGDCLICPQWIGGSAEVATTVRQ